MATERERAGKALAYLPDESYRCQPRSQRAREGVRAHWFSLQKENIVDDQAYFLSHFMRCAQETFTARIFQGEI